MTTLICGSLAFDNIMVFPDRFKNHILPEQIHILNVAFLVPEMRREFGGCAGNIAYNLIKMTSGEGVTIGPILLGAARPVHVLTSTSTVRRLVNMTALAVVEAMER